MTDARHRIPDHGLIPLRSRATVLIKWLTGQSVADTTPTRHDGTQHQRGAT